MKGILILGDSSSLYPQHGAVDVSCTTRNVAKANYTMGKITTFLSSTGQQILCSCARCPGSYPVRDLVRKIVRSN